MRKSLSYWLRAGRNAAQRSAHIEASAHLYKGLDVAYRLPEDTERTAVELNFHFELGPCLIATKGPASSEAMATFTKARRLCEQLGDPPEYLQILFWQTTASVIRGELVRANKSIDALLSLAKVRRDVPALLNATRGQAMILLFMGRFTEAREALNQAVDIFHSSDEFDQLAARAAGQDALVADLALLSWTLWIMGHIDQAVESIDAAIGRAETLDHPHTKAYAYYYSSVLHALRDENDIALDYAERCLNLSERHAFRQWHGLSTAVKGICIARIDNSMAALVPVTTALDDYHRSGYQLGITALLVLMCRALLVNEQPERAIEVAERGLIIVDQNSERVFQAELLRLKALALWMKRGFNAGTEADQCNVTTLLERALVIAEHGQARTQALDCAIDLFSTTQAGARRDLSYQKLISIYRSFTDGFNTHLLRRARSVLGNMP